MGKTITHQQAAQHTCGIGTDLTQDRVSLRKESFAVGHAVTASSEAMHVGVSCCGRLFSCDVFRDNYGLWIGSCRTGKSAMVCGSKTSATRSQNTHPHAYLTPDLKWLIFNSNRSGFPHIYAASVPEEFVNDVLTTG